MEIYLIRIYSLVAIALAYLLFDVFNNRNVPSYFVYATLAYGALLTLLYFNIYLIGFSALIAIAVLALGYLVYKIGQLGAADVVELAALSLMLPLQGVPYLVNIPQLNLPFAISLIINSGIAALVIVPIYYIPRAFAMRGKLSRTEFMDHAITKKVIFKAVTVTVAYLALLLLVVFEFGADALGAALIIILLLGSVSVILFEDSITSLMVERVSVEGFEPGDIIAMNMMTKKEISEIKGKVKGFGGLITDETIRQFRKKHFRKKLPVYKRAIPFAVPIFIGVLVSLLLGNLILLLIPA